MNSAPAFVTISHILIFSSSVRRHVSMMTFKIFPSHASWIWRISSSTSSYFLSFKKPILITISISDAPFTIASFVSNTFVAVVLYPFGNPITVQIGSFPSTYSAACFTYAAGIHAEAVSYLIPSSRIVLISSHVAVCVNNV